MNNYWETNYKAGQEGPTTFRYSLQPHHAYDSLRAQQFGIERSQPLVIVPVDPQSKPMALPVQVSGAGVVVTCLKPANNGEALILRLFNSSAAPTQARVACQMPGHVQTQLCDLAETTSGPGPGRNRDGPLAVCHASRCAAWAMRSKREFSIMTVKPYAVALLLLASSLTPSLAADCPFVVDGVPKHVQVVGQPWTQDGDYLTCSGTGNYLYAPQRLGPGDFVVEMKLCIRKLAKSAASLVVNNSHFGFEGGGGEMFTEGPLFGARNLGMPIVKEGQPFVLVLRRTENQLAIEVDGQQVYSTEVLADRILRVGLASVAQYHAGDSVLRHRQPA